MLVISLAVYLLFAGSFDDEYGYLDRCIEQGNLSGQLLGGAGAL